MVHLGERAFSTVGAAPGAPAHRPDRRPERGSAARYGRCHQIEAVEPILKVRVWKPDDIPLEVPDRVSGPVRALSVVQVLVPSQASFPSQPAVAHPCGAASPRLSTAALSFGLRKSPGSVSSSGSVGWVENAGGAGIWRSLTASISVLKKS